MIIYLEVIYLHTNSDKHMRKFLGYILTPIFYTSFFLMLIIFHPIQWLCLKIGGYAAHKKSVDLLNAMLVASYYTLGNSVRFIQEQDLQSDRPIIFVANHQSTYDIPPLIYFLRKHHGKFISKIELATAHIPSISFNLKYGGAANIDRKDPKQSIAEILKLANNMRDKNWSAFIFPEGTRTKTGQMKNFAIGGIATLLKKNPDALIVPIAINGSYEMTQFGAYPLMPFTKMSWQVLSPIDTTGKTLEEIVLEAEQAVRQHVR